MIAIFLFLILFAFFIADCYYVRVLYLYSLKMNENGGSVTPVDQSNEVNIAVSNNLQGCENNQVG